MTNLHFIIDYLHLPRKHRKMDSLVCIVGREENYLPQEIASIESFSRDYSTREDDFFDDKRQSACVSFEKARDGCWCIQREGWMRRYFKPTLNEALAEMYAGCLMPVPPSLLAQINPQKPIAAQVLQAGVA